MKQLLITAKLTVLIMISSFNLASGTEYFPALPLEFRQDRMWKIQAQIEKRWEKVKDAKQDFIFYKNKSDKEIVEEFKKLDNYRNRLWYRNPNKRPLVSNEDYTIAQGLLHKGNDQWPLQWLAFDYNHVDDTFNASTILIDGFHFIALKEPVCETVDAFFKILMNQDVKILIRLNPENENENISINYWEDKLIEGPYHHLIQTKIEYPLSVQEGATIPYFFTNNWIDNAIIELEELYKLISDVRKAYSHLDEKGPIACHCSAGVGRTGTFIAAFIIAENLDMYKPKNLSIESIVLELSIQRPKMVFNEKQYLLLYRFVEYYIQQRGFANIEL